MSDILRKGKDGVEGLIMKNEVIQLRCGLKVVLPGPEQGLSPTVVTLPIFKLKNKNINFRVFYARQVEVKQKKRGLTCSSNL